MAVSVATPNKHELTVAAACRDEEVVYINQRKKSELHVGDFVLLTASNGQKLVIWANVNDWSSPTHVIQMTELTRRKLRVEIGDVVRCEGSNMPPRAECVCFDPLGDILQTYKGDILEELLKPALQKSAFVHTGNTLRVNRGGGTFEFKLCSTDPSPFCMAVQSTLIVCAGKSIRRGICQETKTPRFQSFPKEEKKRTMVETKKPLPRTQLAECPVCMDEYNEQTKPMVMACGHTVCGVCLQHCSLCSLCRAPILVINPAIGRAIIAYEILRMNQSLHEMTLQNKKLTVPHVLTGDDFPCNGCNTVDLAVRMRICETCMEKCGSCIDMNEELLAPFIICTTCCADEHNGHKLRKYLPWKVQEMARSSSKKGIQNAVGIKELRDSEVDKGTENYGKWLTEMESFSQLDPTSITYEEAVALKKQLSEEAELVCQAADDTLFPLKRFNTAVKESTERLQKMQENRRKN